jgi:psiF repeat
MKITALAAVALIGCSAVFAADSPPATTATPSGASANPVKPMSLKACNKQADAKSLTGAQRSTFVKNCRGGNKAPHG